MTEAEKKIQAAQDECDRIIREERKPRSDPEKAEPSVEETYEPCEIHGRLKLPPAEGGDPVCDFCAAVAAESKLWHETCQGKRSMYSDDRVMAVYGVIAAETERCAKLVAESGADAGSYLAAAIRGGGDGS